MTNEEIVRAWKDPSYRSVAGASAPVNPAGSSTLTASTLGGDTYMTSPICTDYGPRCSVGPKCPY